MKVNRHKLLSLFQLDEAPSCRESSELAQAYIVSCAEALEKFGEEEPVDRMNEITVAYTALVEHGDLCDACQGAAGETPHTQTWWAEQGNLPRVDESSPEYQAGLEIGFQAGLALEPSDDTRSAAREHRGADAEE